MLTVAIIERSIGVAIFSVMKILSSVAKASHEHNIVTETCSPVLPMLQFDQQGWI